MYVIGPCRSPTDSPVRLGVSPAASTPTGVCSQRFEASSFPRWSPGLRVCFTPQLFLGVYLHVEVGPPVLQPPPHRETSPPGCPSLPRLLVWVSVSSLTPWLSDFHTVRFSVSSGCPPMPPSWLDVLWTCILLLGVRLDIYVYV